MQWEPIELPIDVELPQLHRVADGSFERIGTRKCSVEIQFIQRVHLWHVRHCNSAARRKLVPQPAGLVGLQNVHGIGGHIRRHVSFALIRRLARRMNVHHEVTNRAARAKLDLGVAATHAREAVDTVNDHFISMASYALDGDRVVTKSRDEAVLLRRRGGPAGEHCQSHDSENANATDLSNHVSSLYAELDRNAP